MLVILGDSSSSWTQAGIFAFLSKELTLGDKLLDVNVIQMTEGVSLVAMIFILVDNSGIASIDYILNEVRGIIDFCQLVLTIDARYAFLDSIFGLHLEHLAPLTDKIIPSRHLLSCSALKLQESFDCHESDALDWTLDRHVEHGRNFWQNG